MSVQYKPRDNGRDYVDRTEEFANYATFLMLNMPEEWKELLTVPVAKAAQNIETCVEEANAVFIHDPSQREIFIQDVRQRRELLHRALRGFRDFDRKLDRVLDQIDLMQSEKERLKKIMISLIEDAKKSDEDITEIRLVSRMGDVEYRSAGGGRVYRLKLTQKQKDHLLKLESEARKAIKNRIEKDSKQLKAVMGTERR